MKNLSEKIMKNLCERNPSGWYKTVSFSVTTRSQQLQSGLSLCRVIKFECCTDYKITNVKMCKGHRYGTQTSGHWRSLIHTISNARSRTFYVYRGSKSHRLCYRLILDVLIQLRSRRRRPVFAERSSTNGEEVRVAPKIRSAKCVNVTAHQHLETFDVA